MYIMHHVRNETMTEFQENYGEIKDDTCIKSTETRWATVGFMRHTCTLNISLIKYHNYYRYKAFKRFELFNTYK